MDIKRVLIVDDSAYNRRTILKILENEPYIKVVGTAINGEDALRKTMQLKPDIITLDLEMPYMDGFTFLRILMKVAPTPVIVVSSKDEDENVFKAMELGALDFLPKPVNNISIELLKIKEDLISKIKAISKLAIGKVKNRDYSIHERLSKISESLTFNDRFRLIAIGASTGGPPAIQTIFSSLPEDLPAGIVVAQHMPQGFTKAFAERLNRLLPFEVKEASIGDKVEPGRIIIAKGGTHILFKKKRNKDVIIDLKSPDNNDRYVPSVDMMFSSAADIYGDKVVGIILTGMGRDGSIGVKRIKDKEGIVLAESEETSIVFGMPKEAINTGAIDKVVPLNRIGNEIIKLCSN